MSRLVLGVVTVGAAVTHRPDAVAGAAVVVGLVLMYLAAFGFAAPRRSR